MLTNRGAIVADLHVGLLDEAFLLESAREAMPRIQQTLERYIIADDVTLRDLSGESVVWGLEGPLADAILESATGESQRLAEEAWAERSIAGHPVRIAAFGFTGEVAYQLRMPPDAADAVLAALDSAAREVGLESGLRRGDEAALEVLRVEAGIPLLGAELDEDVLPPEARLERAVSTSKGCYVGQEIVARLRSRGQVNHLLVGLRIESDGLPAVGTLLQAEGRRTGEITSAVVSPTEGPIALGYVRRAHAEPETRIDYEGGIARVAALPFVRPGGQPGGQPGGRGRPRYSAIPGGPKAAPQRLELAWISPPGGLS